MAQELSLVAQKWLLARESTYNTDEIDLANNLAVARRYAVMDRGTTGLTPNVDNVQRSVTHPSFGSAKSINIPRNVSVRLGGSVRAASNPGNAGGEYPFTMSDAMVAAGMTETIVSTTSATYVPSTTATAGLSIYNWRRMLDAYTWQNCYATGVRGNFSMTGNVQEIATWAFEGESANFPDDAASAAGHYGWSKDLAWFDSDGTILLDKNGASIIYTGTETVESVVPMYLEAATLTIDSIAHPVSSFTLNHNNTVRVKQITSGAPTTQGVFITNRGVTLEVQLEETGSAFENILADAKLNTEVSGTLVLTDRLGSGGSTLTITLPKLQYMFPTEAEVDGMAAWSLRMQANGNWASSQLGDNEISYAWTVTA